MAVDNLTLKQYCAKICKEYLGVVGTAKRPMQAHITAKNSHFCVKNTNEKLSKKFERVGRRTQIRKVDQYFPRNGIGITPCQGFPNLQNETRMKEEEGRV